MQFFAEMAAQKQMNQNEALRDFWQKHKNELGDDAEKFRLIIDHNGGRNDYVQFLVNKPDLLNEFMQLWQKVNSE